MALVRHTILTALLLAAGISPPRCAAADALPTKAYLPADMAVRMAQAAVAACAVRHAAVAAAIVDAAGGLRVLVAADGVKGIDVESARRKARTASALDVPTSAAAAAVARSPAYGRLLLDLDPALLLLAGGLPIIAGSASIGAIGIGGAPDGAQDEACASAGLAAVGLARRPGANK